MVSISGTAQNPAPCETPRSGDASRCGDWRKGDEPQGIKMLPSKRPLTSQRNFRVEVCQLYVTEGQCLEYTKTLKTKPQASNPI